MKFLHFSILNSHMLLSKICAFSRTRRPKGAVGLVSMIWRCRVATPISYPVCPFELLGLDNFGFKAQSCPLKNIYRLQYTQYTEYIIHNIQSTLYTIYRVQYTQYTEYSIDNIHSLPACGTANTQFRVLAGIRNSARPWKNGRLYYILMN